MKNHTLRTFGIILLIHIRQMKKCKNCWFHLNNEHFMQTNDVFPRRTKNVPQITLLNVTRSNRINFIKVFFNYIRFEIWIMFYHSKTRTRIRL